MTSETGQNMNRREALPAGIGSDLDALDARIGELARRSKTPAGLVDRVFDASVVLLAQSPLPFGHTRSLVVHTSPWGRLSLAASLALAFVLAARFVAVPIAPGAGGDLTLTVAEIQSFLGRPDVARTEIRGLFDELDGAEPVEPLWLDTIDLRVDDVFADIDEILGS